MAGGGVVTALGMLRTLSIKSQNKSNRERKREREREREREMKTHI